jgi:hypothetical protein
VRQQVKILALNAHAQRLIAHAQRKRKASPGHQRSKGKHQLGVDGYDIEADDIRGAWGIP